uniref:Mitochondria-eating protein C-terminal domain-containing protein n=1 Tax=Magallana gigas TaxID=29159 RepID=A0A8W8KQN8_MAGGI
MNTLFTSLWTVLLLGRLVRSQQLQRLSEIAGTRLTSNNPGITDLSDEFRPLKLNDMFREMYDDKWTDAMEDLSTGGLQDKAAVTLLLQIVKEAFSLCKDSDLWLLWLPECQLLECVQESGPPQRKLHALDNKLTDEERRKLRKYTGALKRKHHKYLIQTCQEKLTSVVSKLIQRRMQLCTSSGDCDVYRGDRGKLCEQHEQKGDFGKAVYKKAANPQETEYHNTPKRQKFTTDTDQQPQSLRQDALDENASNEKNDINQKQQKRMKVKPKEQSSNEDIHTDQQPQQLIQDVEGLGSEGLANVDVDKLPPHWKHHAGVEPSRLSKIAGPKLTSNNPDIADLNDDNRPTKLAEKFGKVYDDTWTDSIEELTGVETRLDDSAAVGFLLRIVMTAYKFCSGPRSLFIDLTDCQTIMLCKDTSSMKVITKLPDAITPDIQQATKMCLRSKEISLVLQKTTRPPIHLSARIPDDGRMNNDIFRAYMKSGTEVDYIVWPVMYLYENGPVLNKGIAQPK